MLTSLQNFSFFDERSHFVQYLVFSVHHLAHINTTEIIMATVCFHAF